MPRWKTTVFGGSFAVGAVVLAGCVPIDFGSYYRPAYDDPSAQALKPFCGGKVGPANGLRFDLDPVLAAELSAAGPRPETLHLELHPHPGIELRFLGDEAAVASAGSSQQSLVSLASRTRLRWPVQVPISMPAQASLAGTQTWVSATFFVELHGFQPPRLLLTWPALLWGDAGRTALEPLELMDDTTWRKYRSAGSSTGFAGLSEGVALSGRWVPDPSPGLEVDFDWQGARAWRWEDPHVRLLDLDSGDERQIPLKDGNVEITIEGMPLSTPISAPSGAETTLTLVVALPVPDAADYEIRLPPVQLKGRRVDLKPIVLERHRHSMRIAPFNC
jgi:hypothetical protein